MNDFRCLAIETATELAGVALGADGRVFARESRGERAPSRVVYEWIGELLAEAAVGTDGLDCIAFGQGPGSFTGVRIAATVAQALAYARDLPVCPVSSLAALAATAMEVHDASHVLACLDARMGQLYVGGYARGEDGSLATLVPDQLCDPDDVPDMPVGRYLAAGPGWSAWPELAARRGGRLAGLAPDVLPSARQTLGLARGLAAAGRTVSAFEALPNYLRSRVTR